MTVDSRLFGMHRTGPIVATLNRLGKFVAHPELTPRNDRYVCVRLGDLFDVSAKAKRKCITVALPTLPVYEMSLSPPSNFPLLAR